MLLLLLQLLKLLRELNAYLLLLFIFIGLSIILMVLVGIHLLLLHMKQVGRVLLLLHHLLLLRVHHLFITLLVIQDGCRLSFAWQLIRIIIFVVTQWLRVLIGVYLIWRTIGLLTDEFDASLDLSFRVV